jgi:hypothetical protein
MKVGALWALCLAAALGACQTAGYAPSTRLGISVTRFHLGQPIFPGAIRVEPADRTSTANPEYPEIAASLEEELGRLGWSVARGGGETEQVALFRIEQGSREALRRRSGLSLGFGGSSLFGGGGVGIGATVPLGRNRSRPIVVTELSVRIQRGSDSTVIWEGRAQLEALAGTREASPAGAGDRLAEALFRDFPGESGRTIRTR